MQLNIVYNKSKTIYFLLIFIIISLPSLSQDGGIKFEMGLSWKEIQAKAKTEKKYIFMDCYATWCGPCKFMSKYIFVQKEVGDYINAHFVSVAVQMDRTMTDAEAIKLWYNDATVIRRDYAISLLPTFLFFNPDGQPLHRVTGASKDGPEFLARVAETFDPNKQYYTFINHYKDHLDDSLFQRNALASALEVSDNATIALIGNTYFDCLKDPLAIDNIKLLAQITQSSNDKGFWLFLNQASQIDSIINRNDYAESKIRSIINKEEIDPIFEKTKIFSDWKNLLKNLKKKFPAYANRIVDEAKRNYYGSKKMWTEYENSTIAFLNNYGKKLNDFDLNNIVWSLFKHSNRQEILLQALQWSKRTIANFPNCDGANVDTYANLLYKTGDKESAILWEKRAFEMPVSPAHKREFAITLEKMEKGETTWPMASGR